MQIIGSIFVFIATLFVMSLLIALPVWLLWNDIMPELFKLPKIGFWMALKISLLCSCLFKSSSSSSSKD